MPDMPEAVVLIVCHNGRSHLRDCLQSVIASDDSPIQWHIVVVDNASSDGSVELLEAEFPRVDVLRSGANLGFAGGNNAGWEWIRRRYPSTQYVALLNQDTLVQGGWLAALVAHLENRPTVAAAQSLILLHPQTDRINTAGNQSHFLGFGFTSAYGETDAGQFTEPSEINFPSGAATLIRADALARTGLFDALYFLYLEDAELGWKLRQLAYRIDMVPASRVMHKYAFNADYRHYFFLERNRWYLLATYYKTPTLLMLSPIMAIMEAGQFYFAWRNKVLGQKVKAVAFFLNAANIARLCRGRAIAQRRRLISDRKFTAAFISEIRFTELKSRLLSKVGNPVLRTYWNLMRKVMFW